MNTYRKLFKLIKNRFEFDQFKESLKEKIRRSSADELYISLFVLLVAELEYRLKEFLVHHYNKNKEYYNKDKKYYDKDKKYEDEEYYNKTFGSAIYEFEKLIKNFNRDSLKDYRLKKLFEETYYNSFLKHCREIKDLRNNLYHKLFTKKRSLKEIIGKIKKRTETVNASYIFDSNFYEDDLLHKFSRYRSIIDKNQVPSQWTMELLVEISRVYLRVSMGIKVIL